MFSFFLFVNYFYYWVIMEFIVKFLKKKIGSMKIVFFIENKEYLMKKL